ncbi:MAG: ABC transporter permease [Ardenticatenales bacterium]|nr:ABC transporter permease [Ardenticatenales bacterium]
MLSYIVRRVLAVVPVLIGISFLTFALLHVIGNPCVALLGDHFTPDACVEIRLRYRLDDPLPVRYAHFVGRMLHGDLGNSITTKRPVVAELAEKLPATFELALAAIVLAVLAGIPLGIVAAARHNSAVDVGAMVWAMLGVSMPVFWLGLMLIYVFAFQLGWFPSLGRLPSGLTIPRWSGMYTLDALRAGDMQAFKIVLQHLALPAFALSTIPAAFIARITRSSMLEVLGQDYIRTARAKGVTERAVVARHALKNALLPLVTVIGLQTGALLSGAVLTETIFAWNGVGRWTVDAITGSDYPVVQAGVLVFAVTFVFINLIVDLSYVWLDPRIRYE